MKPLTTTSYAILGLLAVKPWTTYELARQMERSVRNFWPRAERGIYDEPKLLVRHGLARARAAYTGRRRATIYSITPKGRRALRAWLDEPGATPSLECEALLKVFLADHGSKQAMLANIRAIKAWAETEHRQGIEFVSDYATAGGPFPERLHVIAVMVRFLGYELDSAVLRWAAWAEREVARWPDTRTARPNTGVFREYLRSAAEQLGDATGASA